MSFKTTVIGYLMIYDVIYSLLVLIEDLAFPPRVVEWVNSDKIFPQI